MLDRYAQRLLPFVPSMLRVMVGLTFLLNGYPKMSRLAGYTAFVRSLGIPAPEVMAWIPAIVEPVGGLLLIVGLGTRWVSLYFTVEMIITTVVAKLMHGVPFIRSVEWLPTQPGSGYELDVILLAASAALVVLGAGQWSIDRNILRRERLLTLESVASSKERSPGAAGALPV